MEVQAWSHEEVRLWIKESRLSPKVLRIIEERSVTGEQLLKCVVCSFSTNDLPKLSSSEAKEFMQALRALRDGGPNASIRQLLSMLRRRKERIAAKAPK